MIYVRPRGVGPKRPTPSWSTIGAIPKAVILQHGSSLRRLWTTFAQVSVHSVETRSLIIAIDLDDLHHAELLVVHHVAMDHEAPRKVAESRPERHASVARHHHGVVPARLAQLLAIDRCHLEGIGVDVKDMIVVVLVDNRPLLDRAERNAMVDAVWVESTAADQKCELLVVRCWRKFRLLGR